MPQPNSNVSEQLHKLEKIIARVIRKSLKNNTLDYTVQVTVSSLDPTKIQWAAMISSPARGVQPITFVFDTYELLEGALKEAEKDFNPRKIEIAFHENTIAEFRNRADAHEKRKNQLLDPNFEDPEDDDIEMESV